MPPAKSMYSLPSTSTRRAPCPWSAMIGASETPRATYWSRLAINSSVLDPDTCTAMTAPVDVICAAEYKTQPLSALVLLVRLATLSNQLTQGPPV